MSITNESSRVSTKLHTSGHYPTPKISIVMSKYDQRKPITHLATCFPLQIGTIIQHLLALLHELTFPNKITTHHIFEL
jgi:hypothetical protein